MLPVIAHRYGGRRRTRMGLPAGSKTVDQEDQVRLTSSRSWLFSFQRARLSGRRFQPPKKSPAPFPFQGRHRTREARKPQAFSALLLSQEFGTHPTQNFCVGPRSVALGLLPVNPVPACF